MRKHIKNNNLTVAVDSLGAQLASIQGTGGHEYLWQGDERHWAGRAPNLFPFIARLYEKSYTYRGRRYPMSIHGFADASEFDLIDADETQLLYELRSDESSRKIYPFEFTLSLNYRLEGQRLTVTARVKNRGDSTLLYAYGGHPGFNLPLEPGLSFEDYAVTFPPDARPERANMSDDCLRNDGFSPLTLTEHHTLPLRHELFDDDAIILRQSGNELTLSSPDHNGKGRRGIRLLYPDFPYIGLWHTRHSRDAAFLCLEPWSTLPGRSGIVEDLESFPGLRRLEPGEGESLSWMLEIME